MNGQFSPSHMPSRNGIGIAPLIAGIVLAGRSLPRLFQNGLSLWTVLSAIGGCSAILVGLGVLLGWGEFGTETTESDRTVTLALTGLAVASFVGGAILALA